MQKIKMSVCWMFMILLSCRLSHATQPQSSCNEELRNICGIHKEQVHVPCPNVTADEMTFQLIKDQEVISNITCNHENTIFNCMPSHGVMLPQNSKDKLLKFILNGSSRGVYRCEGEVVFPPPYKKVESEVSIQVVVTRCYGDCKESSNSELFWIWIIVIVFLIIYGLTVTITAFVIWSKLRKTDSQSDYMNTKPRAPRDRKKKRGVQYPVPKYI